MWTAELSTILGERCDPLSPIAFGAGDSTILLAGGPTPAPDVDAREDAAEHPVWIVDGRHVASDFGRSYPYAEPPSWLAMAAWSDFAECWYGRSVPVYIALDHYLDGAWPGDPKRCCYFRVERSANVELRRKGGALRGIECRFADGRMFVLDDVIRCAMVPETKPPVHPMDAPPWRLQDGEWVRADRTPR
jgi:hypothetical protein